jgi:membrane-associated PAP2 superfamily phosphatase
MQPYKFIFYDGIKKLLIAIGVLFLFAFFMKKFKEYKKGILIVVLSAIIIPVFIGFLKRETNMPCPKNVVRYGGVYPKTKVWEHYPKGFHKPRIKCWPAGHASGGFALMSLFFLFKRKRNKIIGLLVGISIGWAMGIYKMMIGDHFLSHTILTMLIAWLIILINAKLVNKFFIFDKVS